MIYVLAEVGRNIRNVMGSNFQLGKYKHYKGMMCEVLEIAKHSETLEEMVLYKELDSGSLWVRPLKMFIETVEVNGKQVPRFEYIG